ncbi:MAG: glycosyltransferase family 39 protein [Acidobacteria bacterium]|nr:glycosyltransferase family 39 protein [Acidobacteriota bacterium]
MRTGLAHISIFRRRADLAVVLAVSLLFVAATRLPLMPTHLFSFDSANLAFALDDFDPARSQPQPPGYPLFVGEARLVNALLGSPERTFAFIRVLVSGLAVGSLYFLARSMFSPQAGLVAAALLLTNPAFWFSGLTSALRPHSALFAILVAYFCWRAWKGDSRYFFFACLALGFGSGFRPVLLFRLLPLVAWTGWKVGGWRSLSKGALVVTAASVPWIIVLIHSCGGLVQTMEVFARYSQEQASGTSMFFGASLAGWRRMAGRAILWNGLWTLPWIWAIPTVWRDRKHWPEWLVYLKFVALWFIPSFFVSFLVHIAEPDHALASIPAICLLGAFVITVTEHTFHSGSLARWKQRGLAIWLMVIGSFVLLYVAQQPKEKWLVMWLAMVGSLLFLLPQSQPMQDRYVPTGHGALVCLALLANIILFFTEIEVPRRDPNTRFRGWDSVKDAFLIGTFESSYSRVRWISETTALTMEDLAKMEVETKRPLVVIWSRDGVPGWRRLAYYHPMKPIYELEEKGYPGYTETMARLWRGNSLESKYTGQPISIPVPERARLIWIMAGGREKELERLVPIRKARAFYYTDLAPHARRFRWGDFEFVPGGESLQSRYEAPETPQSAH